MRGLLSVRSVMLACTLGLTAALLVPSYASAANAPNASWSIAPAGVGPAGATSRETFQFTAHPGQTVTDSFVVANRTAQSITFNLYSADAYNTKVGAAFALKLANAKQIDVGHWITLPTDKMVLPARTEATVTYAMHIPVNATPGDHTGGIVAQDATPTIANKGAVQVPVIEGAGVRVYVRVAGPVHPSLAVANPQISYSYPAMAWFDGSGKGRVAFDVDNTGNTRLDVVAHVKAVNLFGTTVKTFPATNITALLPGSSSVIVEPTNSLPHLGLVRYDISLQSKTASANASTQAYLIPWVLVLIVVVLLLLVAYWWWRRRRRRRAAPAADATAGSPRKPAPEPASVG